MDPLRRATAPGARFPFRRLALTVAAGLLLGSTSYAATFGHSRIASGVGEPLLIMVPVSGLSAQDIQSLSARVAPAADWTQAGLVPPVALDGLRVSVEPGLQPETRMLRVQSSQALEGPLVDLLIDVQTSSGQQRYQVTLLASGLAQGPGPVTSATATAAGSSAGTADAVGGSTRHAPEASIAVRRGDTMFSIARRHAVDGVTVYQMMMALQRANPQAFIEQNVNLVKAGERLIMPGMDELLALSDRDARREFQAQAAAFAQYRARQGGAQLASIAQAEPSAAAQGGVSQPEGAAPAPAAQGDHLRLSGAAPVGASSTRTQLQSVGQTLPQAQTQAQAETPTRAQAEAQAQVQADTRTAQGKAIADTEGRVSQLEENVGHLSQALKAQGEAARSIVMDGAKDLSDSLADVANAVSQASRDAVYQADEQAMQPADSGHGGDPAGAAGTADPAEAGAAADGRSPSTSGSASAPPSTSSGALPAPSSSASSANLPATAAPQGASTEGSPADRGDSMAQPVSEKAQSTVSWLQEHLLGVITGLLALIVLIIAWLLRRANTTRDEVYEGARVTEAMVRQKLQNIDLDLSPDADKATRRDG